MVGLSQNDVSYHATGTNNLKTFDGLPVANFSGVMVQVDNQ